MNPRDFELAIVGANEVSEAAFIFGQEPDVMRGAYDKNEAFLGDLAEFHVWNKVLNDRDIQEIASCKNGIKGNIINWENTAEY